MRTLRLAPALSACHTPPMRILLILALLLPSSTLAQARADSERYQNNHMSPQSQQAQRAHQWSQNTPRTADFCDRYARDVSRPSGHNTTANLARNLGYIGTRDGKQADALGMIGGAISGNPQAQQTPQQVQNLYQLHYRDCLEGKTLRPSPQ
ncbi:hypothetical protein [Shimia sp. MMG029]|uniref:hypothetical protein n=1 Tax=Shimia sp. MMG029 TaxID=3021978 RepID=UPI0022FEBC7C|nr:hypothetical protein [Shimia sp. MMG029]MDA5556136.1 hypothetical protein [Shimia sp. MMG029]